MTFIRGTFPFSLFCASCAFGILNIFYASGHTVTRSETLRHFKNLQNDPVFLLLEEKAANIAHGLSGLPNAI
jgi:hypothetical protein